MAGIKIGFIFVVAALNCVGNSYAIVDFPSVFQNLYDYENYKQYNTEDYSTDLELAALGDLLNRLALSGVGSGVTPAPSHYGEAVSRTAKMAGYGFPAHSSSYDTHVSQGYGQQLDYSHQQQSYHQPSYQQTQPSYQQAQPSYQPVQQSYHQASHYQSQQSYQPLQTGYRKPKKERVYVPVVIRKKKQKKRKTIAVFKGFYIEGGTQIFGKFKRIEDCKKACEITPNCFAADFNPWLKKCYIHTNTTACTEMRTHPKLIHFKKIPCDMVETPRGRITPGAQIFGGLVQKGIKSLQDCIKRCATAGQGIAPDTANIAQQICTAIDYDFGSHKCYFHTDEALCPGVDPIPTPVTLVAAPSVINIILCPFAA